MYEVCNIRHQDFQRIYDEFVGYYREPSKGESEYYSWVHALGVDESKPYGSARESFKWAKSMLNYLKEDADNKYYGVIVGLPWRSMNGNVYKERDLIAAALSLKGKHPSLNHKESFWFNEQSRYGTLTVEDAKYEEGAIEAVLKVPKSAVCPICNGAKMTELIDKQHIVNVSLEGSMNGAFEFTDPPFTLLTSDVLPGIPLARIKPLETIMVEALQFQQNKGEKKKMTIKAKIIEESPNTATFNPPKPNVDTGSMANPDFKGTFGTPIDADGKLHSETQSSGNATVQLGNAPGDYPVKSGDDFKDAKKAAQEHKIAEPFADYTDFDDCVAKNSGKEDPAAYCASIQAKAESAAPTGNYETPGGGQATPQYAGVTGGVDRSKAPSAHWGPEGSLPSSADHTTIMGTSPGSIGVKAGSAPVESLPSLEERKAAIQANLRANTAEEKAVKFEEEYGKIYSQLQQYIGANASLNQSNKALEKLRDEAIRELANKEVERDQWRKKYEHQLSLTEEFKSQLENTRVQLTQLNEKYGKSMSTNLELSQKITQTNEDYLEIHRKLESSEEALGRAKNEAKKITRITA